MKGLKKGLFAVLMLCTALMFTSCSYTETLKVLWNGGEKSEDSENKEEKEVALDSYNIDENIEVPVIVSEMGDPLTYDLNQETEPIVVEATVNDGGTLSYQWYRNNVDFNGGGTLMEGEISNELYPPSDISGTSYYYVVVTNTKGKGIQLVTSGTKCITITEELAMTEETVEEPEENTLPTKEAAESRGDAAGSWSDDESGRHFIYEDGTAAVSKWEKIGGAIYCFNENGVMRTGWYQEGDKIYFFQEDGSLLRDGDIDGYHLGSDGAVAYGPEG